MEKEISVVVADSSDAFRKLLSELIDAEGDMYVAASAENGLDAVEKVTALQPDVLVCDLLLREMEGLALIRKLKEGGVLPHTIVVSGFFNDRVAETASGLGVESFFPKPCRVTGLIECIRDCVLSDEEKAGKLKRERERAIRAEMGRLIDDTILKSGVMPHLQGYLYLRDALNAVAEDRSLLRGVTKVLYPELARRYGTDAVNVERCIRSALDIAWRRGDREKREQHFGPAMSALIAERPTNIGYMNLVIEHLDRRMREKKEQ